MVRALRDERGRERMAADRDAHRKPDLARTASPYSATASSSAMDADLRRAAEHRDRLLGYQATDAQRTRIIDQAADFETPTGGPGLNPWATPAERALQLKRQQAVLARQQWNARPDHEKRRVVVAIDLQGRRITREMRDIDPPSDFEADVSDVDAGADEDDHHHRVHPVAAPAGAAASTAGSGAFARNPLLKGLVRPKYTPQKGKGKGKDKGKQKLNLGDDELLENVPRGSAWRRVQDDFTDNEKVILDGGVAGGGGTGAGAGERATQGEEPDCG